MEPRELLIGAFHAGVAAVSAEVLLPPHLPRPVAGRNIVVAAGKAAAAMAAVLEAHWPKGAALEGIAITRHGHGAATARIEVVEAGHPLPDAAGLAAAQRLLDLVQSAGPEDQVIALLSGGGSSLLTWCAGVSPASSPLISSPPPNGNQTNDAGGDACATTSPAPAPTCSAGVSPASSNLISFPPQNSNQTNDAGRDACATGVSLADLRFVANALLASGAPIAEINCVRKHLSPTLGGRLARACRGRTTALLISDVTGDDPAVIASGPFSPDPATLADARAVLARWNVTPPDSVRRALQQGEETPKPNDPCFEHVSTRVIGNGRTMLEGAASFLIRHGIEPVILGDTFTGEAREAAKTFAALARGNPWNKPVALLSGGETSVTVKGKGRGGRNTEFLLALALEAVPGLFALAADSDGIDGSEDNAGALLTPDTLPRAAARGLDLRAYLAENDAYTAFARLGDLLVTGPTRTNANDFRVLLLR